MQGRNTSFRRVRPPLRVHPIQAPSSYGSGALRSLRIWGFRGPGFRSGRQVLCGDASRLFLDPFPKHLSSVLGRTELDERQITYLICARLKYDLYDLFRGVFGPLVYTRERTGSRPKTPLKKSYIDHFLGGHRLDEQSGARLSELSATRSGIPGPKKTPNHLQRKPPFGTVR